MFLGMGPLELIIVAVVVLVIFGPKNLPKLGSTLGKTVKSVREGMDMGDDEAKDKKPEASQAKPAADVEVEDASDHKSSDE